MILCALGIGASIPVFAHELKGSTTSHYRNDGYEDWISSEEYNNPSASSIRPFADSDQPTLPLENYPSGSYFSKRASGCTCHPGCTYTQKCDCINYQNTIQCLAFARFVFSEYNGVECSSANEVAGLAASAITASSVKNDLSSLPKGSHVRYGRSVGFSQEHSFIIIAKYASSVKIYDANWEPNCKVTVRTVTYEDLTNEIGYIKKAWRA